MNELPAVGFESVHPHIQQVLPLGKPAFYRLRVGEIRHHGAGKPVAVGNGIGAAVRHRHAQLPSCRVRPVQVVLQIGDLVSSLLFVHRHLPQQQLPPRLVKLLDHSAGVRPGGIGEVKIPTGQRHPIRYRRIFRPVPDVEGGLVAPRLQHHHRGGKIIPLQLLQEIFHIRLAIPAVGRHPDPQRPLRRQNSQPEQVHILPDHLLRRTGKQHHIRRLRQCHVHLALPKGKYCRLTGIHVEAKAGIRPEKRGGTIGLIPLEAELLPHLVDHSFSLLVQAVILFPHAVGTAVGKGYGEPLPFPTDPCRTEGQFFCLTGNSFHRYSPYPLIPPAIMPFLNCF